jgi:hypothetical protein
MALGPLPGSMDASPKEIEMHPITALMLSQQAEEERRAVIAERRARWLQPEPMSRRTDRLSLVEIFQLSRLEPAGART